MADDKLLALLQDPKALLEAYAASSARGMRLAFQQHKELAAFKGRADLAPVVLEKLMGLGPLGDPVFVGAHLYALELSGARRETAKAVGSLLRGQGRKDPYLVGQLAGITGAGLLRSRGPGREQPNAPARALKPKDLDEILQAVEREEGQP